MTRRKRRDRTRQALTAATFVTFGIAAAFLVSAVAGVLDEDDHPRAGADPAATARTLERGVAVRVEVLNGAGRTGLARQATDQLRGDGFDVVFFGNATRFDHARSVVLDRADDPVRARAVARALGIDSVASAPDPSLLLDVSVVLGSDWPPATPPRRSILDRVRELAPGARDR